MKHLFNILAILLFASSLFGQGKTYEYAKPGNRCYFEYIAFAPNEDYAELNRPIIYVIGKAGQTLPEVLKQDSLKLIPKFYNYLFYYVPLTESNPAERLNCLDAMAAFSSNGFAYGRTNFFLAIKEPSIEEADVTKAGLDDFFSATIYPKHQKEKALAAFEAKASNPNTYISSTGRKEQVDEFATYYVDEEVSTALEEENQVKRTISKKTYTGKPTRTDFTLSGVVRDKVSGESLPFANILVKGTKIGASTTSSGMFTLLHIPTDTNTLIVQYIGYEEERVYLTPNSPIKNLQIKMFPASQSLKEVTVVGAKQNIQMEKKGGVSVIKLDPKLLEKMPSLGEKDAMRSLQLMPGVSSANESSSGLYVRGGTPDQNLVLFDGFTVYYVDHLYGFFSAFNANAIKDLQLYKGGFESKFGGRLSSVTEITGKDGNQNKFNIGGDISLLSVNAFAEIPIGDKISSIFTYRRSYTGFLYNTIFEKFNGTEEEEEEAAGGGGRSGGGPNQQTTSTTVSNFFYDFNGKVTYRPTDEDVISISFYNGADKLDNSTGGDLDNFGGGAFNFSSTDLTKYGNIGTSLRWSKKWTDKLYGNTTLSYSNYYSDRELSQNRTIVANTDTTSINSGIFESNDLRDYSLKSDYDYKITNNLSIQTGFFSTMYNVKYTYAQSDTATLLDKSASPFLGGIYLQSPLSFAKDRITFLPGLRATYYEGTQQFYVEPRANFTALLDENFTLKASTGRFYQYINQVTREDILSGGKNFWIMADGVSVPVSSANHYILGGSYETNQYLFSIEGYYKTINNLTEYSLRFSTQPRGVTTYSENFYSGNGFAQGVEFLAQRKYGKISGWASYTLAKANNQFDVFGDEYFAANQDVTNEFKIVAMHSYKRWDFSATWIYATGRPYTAPSGAYTVSLLDGTEQDYYTVSAKNGLRLPDYHRADVSVNYKLLGGSKGDSRRKEIGNIGFSLFNLYNRTNVWYKQYTVENGDILETNVNYLGITPNLSLTLKLR